MRILLLGGNGFIGKNLAQNLSEKHELIIYDKYIDSAYFQKLHVAPENLFMDDIQKFNSYFKKKCKKIDVIVHLISSISPASSMSDVISGYENDLLQSLKIINEIRDKNIKMIFFSSGGTVYGDKTGLITEEMTPKPLNHYGIIKHTLENILLMNNKVYGTNHIILRVSNPYGYNQLSKLNVGIIPIFAQKILKNEKILIYGDGEIVRDFIFIEDLVTMFELLINKFSTNYSIYNAKKTA